MADGSKLLASAISVVEVAAALEKLGVELVAVAVAASRIAALASTATRRFFICVRSVSSIEARTMELMSSLMSRLIFESARSSASPISGMKRSCTTRSMCRSRSRFSLWYRLCSMFCACTREITSPAGAPVARAVTAGSSSAGMTSVRVGMSSSAEAGTEADVGFAASESTGTSAVAGFVVLRWRESSASARFSRSSPSLRGGDGSAISAVTRN